MTKPVLIYNRKGSVTAKNLAAALNMRAVRDDRWTTKYPFPTIRWGTSKILDADEYDDDSINHLEAIGRTAHGRMMLDDLRRNNIYCPEYREGFPEDFDLYEIWLARKVNHIGGKDIRILNCNRDVQQAMADGYRFFVKFIPTSIELRVHVINGEVVKAFKKVNDDPNASPIRTSYRGWNFKRVDIFNKYPRAIPVAINAIKAVGLVFGAVDMAWDINRREWVVWEVNSAPSLNTETLNLYVTELKKLVRKDNYE